MLTTKQIIRRDNLAKKLNTIKNGNKIMKHLQQLRINGMNDNEIEEIFKNSKFPLSVTLFIMGNFSDLMDIKFT